MFPFVVIGSETAMEEETIDTQDKTNVVKTILYFHFSGVFNYLLTNPYSIHFVQLSKTKQQVKKSNNVTGEALNNPGINVRILTDRMGDNFAGFVFMISKFFFVQSELNKTKQQVYELNNGTGKK